MLNDYVTPPKESTEIERTHRIYRKASRTTSDRPPDIIVKFQSYRTRARLLTKNAMVQLREASEDTSDKDKMFISDDLTTVRKELFFKTRTLKKQGHIKSTFTRDGKIIVKLADDDTKWYITTQSDLEAMCTKFKLPLPQLTKNNNNKNNSGKCYGSRLSATHTDPGHIKPKRQVPSCLKCLGQVVCNNDHIPWSVTVLDW